MGVLKLDTNATVLGDRYTTSVEQSYGVAEQADENVAPAKTGSLTTRTNTTTGTLTMDPGHGFTTAAKIDLFWEENGVFKARRGVVLGTVATNSCPISSGSGDDLPPLNTAITAMVPHQEVFNAVGNNVVCIVAKSAVPGFIVLLDGSDAVLLAISIRAAGGSYIWTYDSGVANPLASVTVAKVLTSHNDPLNTRAPKCMVGIN